MQADLFRNLLHTGCGPMPINYSAKHDLEIWYTAKSSFNSRWYMYIIFTCAGIKWQLSLTLFEETVPQSKERKMNKTIMKYWCSILNPFPERQGMETIVGFFIKLEINLYCVQMIWLHARKFREIKQKYQRIL